MSDLIARLRAIDSCAVSDALDRHEIDGVLLGLSAVSTGGRVAGRAVTVSLGPPGDNTEGGPKRHLGTAAVDASGPEQVIVVAHQGRTDCAGWGGLLSRAAVARGVEGVIVDGAARDLAEAAQVGLSVHARAVTPVTARTRTVEHSWGESIEVGGITVSPGDLVLADSGGVVFIPADRADEVVATAEHIAASEAAMAQAIDAGTPVSQVMGKTYEELTGDE